MGIAVDGNGCSCDPAVFTTDCDQHLCTPFLATFIVLEIILFVCYILTILYLEIKHTKKSLLWRIIFPACAGACLAKIIRLGLLASPHTRYSTSPVVLLFLYNTHLCWLSIGFITLLFFWMRLRHDLKLNRQMFGKLLPGYIAAVAATIVFYYAQVVVKGVAPNNNLVSYVFLMLSGFVCFLLAVIFLGYTISIWHSCIKQSDTTSLFYKISLSAIVASALVIACLIEFVVSNTTDTNSSKQYIIKHALYEAFFVAIPTTIPSGFIIHYYRHYISRTERSPSEVCLNSSPSVSSSLSASLSLSLSNSSPSTPTSPPASPPSFPPSLSGYEDRGGATLS